MIAAVSHRSSTTVALALTAASAQSNLAEDWAPTTLPDQYDLPEDRASTPAPAPTLTLLRFELALVFPLKRKG